MYMSKYLYIKVNKYEVKYMTLQRGKWIEFNGKFYSIKKTFGRQHYVATFDPFDGYKVLARIRYLPPEVLKLIVKTMPEAVVYVKDEIDFLQSKGMLNDIEM